MHHNELYAKNEDGNISTQSLLSHAVTYKNATTQGLSEVQNVSSGR